MSSTPDFKPALNLPLWEKAVAAVSPSWGLKRMQSRAAKILFEYQAAQSNRLFSPKQWESPQESSKTVRERKVLMWEARDLVNNFSALASIPEKFSINCTPNEWSPATGDREYDKKVADYFHAWCKRCDVTARHSFRQLVSLAIQMRVVDGDCGFRIVNDADGIRLQLVPADLIGNPQTTSTDDNYVDGIVTDDYGKPLAYRIYRRTTEGAYLPPDADTPARAFCHYYAPYRADQYRGVSEFHAIINTARMLKGILDAEQVGVRFASQQAALVFNERGVAPTSQAFTDPSSPTLATNETRKDEVAAIGTIKYMQQGDKVQVMPGRPSSAFAGFVEHLLHEIADGIGVPYGVLYGTGGYKGPNVRAEFAQADRIWDDQRKTLCDKVLDPIKDDVIIAAIASGELPPPPAIDGETPVQMLRRACRGEWRWPARMTIDIGRESAANLAEHQRGIKSGYQIAAEQGYDYEATLEEKAREAVKVRELAATHGIPETTISLLTNTLPSTPEAAAAQGNETAAAGAEAAAETPPEAPAEMSVADILDTQGRKTRLAAAATQHHAHVNRIKETLGEKSRSADAIAKLFTNLTN